MKQIKAKNYIKLIILIICTIILTFVLANIYNIQTKKVSSFFEYANKITPSEFDQYFLESSDTIIYLSDKYNLNYSKFEENFERKINDFNLKDNLVYIDKKDINKKFISKLKKQYNISIDLNKLPAILIATDNKIDSLIYINENTNAENFIDYEALK